ncbi:MAG: DUF3592 domain-containing protein [Clostridia bacterium]|nr:DUF3592 domain-containing protein [Clostridia bacterium]
MSLKGIRLRYFVMVLALIAIAAGIYLTFSRSKDYEKTTATITSIAEREETFSEDDTEYDVTVEYTVNGQKYTQQLDYYSPAFKVGGTTNITYDPKDPTKIHGGSGFGIYILIIGAVLMAGTLFSIIRGKSALKKLKETEDIGRDAVYPEPDLGTERELCFLTDLGTPKYGHRIEDASRNVLYEAKMTKFTMTSPFGFDFIDHEHGRTTAHLVGHEEASEWNSLIIDNHYTFTFDGEDIWKHLKRSGIRVDSKLGGGSGKLVGTNYTIYRNEVELARVETTSQYVHEEDAEEHKIARAVPVKGFFRIWTRERNLDLLFVTLLAFARTEASADNGGNRKTLFNTLKG